MEFSLFIPAPSQLQSRSRDKHGGLSYCPNIHDAIRLDPPLYSTRMSVLYCMRPGCFFENVLTMTPSGF